MKLSHLFAGVCVLAFSTSVAAAQSTPQSAPEEIEAIIVTAQRRAQYVQDAPLAITVAAGADLARRNMSGLSKHGASLLPYHVRADKAGALSICDPTSKALLDISAQSRIADQLVLTRTPTRAFSVPLRNTGPVIQIAATSGSVAQDFA
jgi:hypothetical protein